MLLELPYPPSVNHYWKRGPKGHVYIGEAGRRFREIVSGILAQEGATRMDGPVVVLIHLFPPSPDRDIDNGMKAVLDALTHGGVYKDDGQIIDLHVLKKNVMKPGRILVNVDKVKCN